VIRPAKIRLEASSACQLRCPACPTTSGAIAAAIGTGHLRFANFKTLIEDNPGIERIELSNYGEIFLNPELLQILELAHRRGVALTADNGVNLNTVRPELLEGLVKYGFRRLSCSIDGATPETYSKYRVGGDFHAVLENVRKINALKSEYGTPYPRLTWQFVVFSHNRHEREAAKRLAERLGMKFVAKSSWSEDSPGVDPPSRRAYRERYGVEYTRGLCHQLWVLPQINWDGRVLGCCRNFWGEFGGNAFTDGILAVSNRERMEYARGMLLGKNPSRADVPCSTCDQYLSMSRNARWLTPSETALPQRVQRWIYRHRLAKPVVFFVLALLIRAAERVHSLGIEAGRKLRRLRQTEQAMS
jgi:Radical SAM superfamily